MPLISPLLNDYDLVVVQEDWLTPDPNPFTGIEVYHELLAKDATHPYQSVPAPLPLANDPRRPEALMSDGLNTFSNFPFGELTRVAWEGCFGFTHARHVLGDGVEVDIYNLHGEAGGTATDQQLSEADFLQLADFVNATSAGRAVIVGGDTNLHTHDGHADGTGNQDFVIWETFKSATGLTDVCDVIDPCDQGIDKAFFRNNGQITITPESHNYARDKFRRSDGADLSDHPPLVVEFSWASAAR
jgi:hypothetical protein